MIPMLNERDVQVLHHLAHYRMEDAAYMPFELSAYGITGAIGYAYYQNTYRRLTYLRDHGLIREFRARVRKHPKDLNTNSRYAIKVRCYQITDKGRSIIRGYREAYPSELGVRA